MPDTKWKTEWEGQHEWRHDRTQHGSFKEEQGKISAAGARGWAVGKEAGVGVRRAPEFNLGSWILSWRQWGAIDESQWGVWLRR